MKRRVISLTLPASDPHSAPIAAWLDEQPAGADIAPEVRRLLALALALAPRLDALDRKLDQVLAGGVAVAPAPARPVGAAEAAALDTLFTFDD